MGEISKRDLTKRLGKLTSAICFVGVCFGWSSNGSVLEYCLQVLSTMQYQQTDLHGTRSCVYIIPDLANNAGSFKSAQTVGKQHNYLFKFCRLCGS